MSFTTGIEELVGHRIVAIQMDDVFLRFITDKGTMEFVAEADCCSRSYFYDFHGVQKLLAGNPVVSVSPVEESYPADDDARRGDCVAAYGFEIVTEDPTFGEVTSVFSFRNDSNGYYGGWLERLHNSTVDWSGVPVITTDCMEASQRRE